MDIVLILVAAGGLFWAVAWLFTQRPDETAKQESKGWLVFLTAIALGCVFSAIPVLFRAVDATIKQEPFILWFLLGIALLVTGGVVGSKVTEKRV